MGEEWIFCIDRKDYWQKIVRSEQCMPGKIEIL
jgi:hypothetical protein